MNNLNNLQKYREARALACEARVLKAIAFYAKCEGRITYKAVAHKAGVNISYFRLHPELKAKITELIRDRKHQPTRYQILQDRIKHLETKLKQLETRHRGRRSLASPGLKSQGTSDKNMRSLLDNGLVEKCENLIEQNQELVRRNEWLEKRVAVSDRDTLHSHRFWQKL